jgi:hypothetical protein
MIKFILRTAVATAVLAAAKKLYGAVAPNISTTAVIQLNNGMIHSSKRQRVQFSSSRRAARLEEASIADGKIRLTKTGRIRFSGSIPASELQRLRNVLLNHDVMLKNSALMRGWGGV